MKEGELRALRDLRGEISLSFLVAALPRWVVNPAFSFSIAALADGLVCGKNCRKMRSPLGPVKIDNPAQK
jgi:hypothetical protein